MPDHRLILRRVVPFPGLFAAFEPEQNHALRCPTSVGHFNAGANPEHLSAVLLDGRHRDTLIGPEGRFVFDSVYHTYEITVHCFLLPSCVCLDVLGCAGC